MTAKRSSGQTSRNPAVPIKQVITQIISRKGFTQNILLEEWERVWNDAVGELIAAQTRIGTLNRGTLEIFVTNAVISQELSFRIAELVEILNAVTPDKKITKIKFTNRLS